MNRLDNINERLAGSMRKCGAVAASAFEGKIVAYKKGMFRR